MTALGCGVSFWPIEDVLKLASGNVQLGEYTQATKLYTLGKF